MTTDTADPQVPHIGADDVELVAGYRVGEYDIQAKIGEGGFGTVFKAVHPLIGKVAAIKVLSRQYSAQPDMVSRFVAEARAVNQIRHRNIIDIFSFGSLDDGRHYYVMEYLDGVPLEGYIRKRGRVPLAEAIAILRAIARALDAAHAKGIAHRDLKPDNVFLVINDDRTIEPKLLDFGIAKLLSDDLPQAHKTRTGAPMGTPHYMSPEQCRGKDVDHRTDIYAFGAMTYKMLTGKLPFDGDDYMEILFKQISAEAAPPSSVVGELSEQVDEAVAWMMKKDPAERPPNLVTAVRSLEDAARAAGIAVPLAPAPSGVYAAHTSPLSAQSTPARMARLPSEKNGIELEGTLDAKAFGDAVTLDDASDDVSDDAGAAGSDRKKPRPAAAAVTAAPEAPARSKSKLVVLAAAVAIAVITGVVINAMLTRNPDASADTSANAAAEPAKEPVITAAAHPDEHAGQAAIAPQPAESPDDPAQPPRPSFVTADIAGPPDGTEVYGPSGLLGVVPGKIQLPHGNEPLLLTFKARRYKTRSENVVPSADLTLTVELERERRRTSTGSRSHGDKPNDPTQNRNTIENPFDNK